MQKPVRMIKKNAFINAEEVELVRTYAFKNRQHSRVIQIY